MSDITEEQRLKDIKESISRGNHKSYSTHKYYLGESMQKELYKGWTILINEEDATKIPGIELSPMGVAEHLGIAKTG